MLDHASFSLPGETWDWSCAEHSGSCSLIYHERLRSFPPKFVGEVVWNRLTPLWGVRGYCKELSWLEEEADLLPWASALRWELPCGFPYGSVLLGGRYLRRMALLCCKGSFWGCHIELAQAALCMALKSGFQVWESEMRLCQQNGVNCAFLKLGFISRGWISSYFHSFFCVVFHWVPQCSIWADGYWGRWIWHVSLSKLLFCLKL